MRTIKCQICGKEVEATSNRQKYCPECKKAAELARKKERYENNKEHILAREKARYENNKEKIRARVKKYYENNKEHILEQKKEYYEDNKGQICTYHKEWYENNKEKHLAQKKEYYEDNKEKIRKQQKEYYEDNYIHADIKGNNFCVYIHTDPIGKVYIGRAVGDNVKTVNRQRWQGGSGYKTQKFYDECIAVYGWENIQHELLEWGLTYEEVIEREKYWIERYNSRDPKHGYNVV